MDTSLFSIPLAYRGARPQAWRRAQWNTETLLMLNNLIAIKLCNTMWSMYYTIIWELIWSVKIKPLHYFCIRILCLALFVDDICIIERWWSASPIASTSHIRINGSCAACKICLISITEIRDPDSLRPPALSSVNGGYRICHGKVFDNTWHPL